MLMIFIVKHSLFVKQTFFSVPPQTRLIHFRLYVVTLAPLPFALASDGSAAPGRLRFPIDQKSGMLAVTAIRFSSQKKVHTPLSMESRAYTLFALASPFFTPGPLPLSLSLLCGHA